MTSTRKKYLIETFGCQMNGHDSERLSGMLRAMGYERADSESDADVIIINTCCVRENAENRVYGNLGRLKHIKETNPDLRIAVCGCMAQRESAVERILTSYKNVDVIFGTMNIEDFPELLYESVTTGGTVVRIKDKLGDEPERAETAVRSNRLKASINIIYGCDNFCSYCIVPYVRGREKSRPPRVIIEEAESLIADGAREIMLLGQNVNSYGKDLAEEKTDFAKLLRGLDRVGGLYRIRFMTSNPKDLTDELIEAVAGCERVCGHLHLPLQSGSTRILKSMNRKYTKDEYVALANRIKEKIPGVGLTTDIIVGFPGETEEDFADTLDVVSSVKFSNAFTFMYSKRPGTPAADMDDQVGGEIVRERFGRLVGLLNGEIHKLNTARVGSTVCVFAEEENRSTGLLTGRAEDNTLVHFTGDKSMIGSLADVKITGSKTFYLSGVAV